MRLVGDTISDFTIFDYLYRSFFLKPFYMKNRFYNEEGLRKSQSRGSIKFVSECESKSSIVMAENRGITVRPANFFTTIYDAHTLPEATPKRPAVEA